MPADRGGDARSVVLHGEAHAIVADALGAQADAPSLARDGVGGVEEQVEEHLHDARAGEHDAREIAGDLHVHVDVAEVLLRLHQREHVVDGLVHRARHLDLPRPQRHGGAREVEHVAEHAVDALGLALHALEKLPLFLRLESALKQQLLKPEDRRERIANLVREPGGEATDRGEALRPHEPLLSAGEIGGVALDLGDLGAQRLLICPQPRRHLRQARPQLDELSRAAPRRLEPPRALGHAARGARELIDRLHDEASHRHVREDEQRERDDARVQRDEAQQRRRRGGGEIGANDDGDRTSRVPLR